MTPGPRKKLGRNVGGMTRELIFETADAIEVESREGYDVTRKRVLFEEILLVTSHRVIGWPYVIGLGLTALFFGMWALVASPEPAIAISMAVLALPFLAACIVRLVLKLDIVTVFGRRSKAVMRFAIRKQRAREVYRRICARTAEVQQEKLAAEPAAPVPINEFPALPSE
jgi:hypothetical protein